MKRVGVKETAYSRTKYKQGNVSALSLQALLLHCLAEAFFVRDSVAMFTGRPPSADVGKWGPYVHSNSAAGVLCSWRPYNYFPIGGNVELPWKKGHCIETCLLQNPRYEKKTESKEHEELERHWAGHSHLYAGSNHLYSKPGRSKDRAVSFISSVA